MVEYAFQTKDGLFIQQLVVNHNDIKITSISFHGNN